MNVSWITPALGILFIAGAGFGLAVGAVLLARRPRQGELEAELRGWLRCERALYAETHDHRVLMRVRTRVPPRLRLRHEAALVQASDERDRALAFASDR